MPARATKADSPCEPDILPQPFPHLSSCHDSVFRELFGYVDLSLSFSLSFSMPIELSFSMPNSRPSPIASGPFTLAPVAAPITPSSPGETDETEPNEDSKASESGVQEAQTASLRKINVGNSAETAMIVVLVAAVVAVLAAAAVRKRSQLKFKAQTSADSEVSSLQSSSANGDMVHAGDGMPMI